MYPSPSVLDRRRAGRVIRPRHCSCDREGAPAGVLGVDQAPRASGDFAEVLEFRIVRIVVAAGTADRGQEPRTEDSSTSSST